MRIGNIQYYTPPAIIWQKPAEFTNEAAIKLLGKELEKSMPKKNVEEYLKMIQKVCKKFNIQEKNLPINSEHPGNLSDEENFNLYESVIDSVVFDQTV